MSEKLYALLLRLYPPEFRKKYAGEAMQVFRDRLRDERGVLKRTRLWLGVLLDLSMSAPREHRRPRSQPAQSPSGIPSFLVLENEPPRPDIFLFGTVLAVIAIGTFGFLLTHGGNRVLFPAGSNEPLRSAIPPAVNASKTGEQNASRTETDATEDPLVTPAEQRLVIRKVIGIVQEYDRYPAEANRVAEMLEQNESSGTYEGIRNGSFFAALLTSQISGLTRHVTVTVMCGEQPSSGSHLWIAPSRPDASVSWRIDDHFAVALAPMAKSRGLRFDR